MSLLLPAGAPSPAETYPGDGWFKHRPNRSAISAPWYHLPVTLHEAYQILGLQHDATALQVKASYRRLVAEAHPDRGGSAADFIRIRAAYEILWAFLEPRRVSSGQSDAAGGSPDDDIPIPPGLRDVIDRIVADFREQQRWAEAETLAHLAYFEKRMFKYIQEASRAELRRFSTAFNETWDSVIDALFTKCNSRCDGVLQRYEAWYTENTQALFDRLYRRELLRFAFRRRFWEVFVVLGGIAGALSVVVGWGGPWRRWVSLVMIVVAAAVAFLAHQWSARRGRRARERVEPLSVVVFEIDKNARFPTESALRRGRRTTTALGLAGAYLGNAASSGFAIPVVGAVAGAAIGGALDRIFNPLPQMRERMQTDLRRFMAMARPQVTAYVLEAHNQLLDDVRVQIVDNYQERAKDVVRLLTTGGGQGARCEVTTARAGRARAKVAVHAFHHAASCPRGSRISRKCRLTPVRWTRSAGRWGPGEAGLFTAETPPCRREGQLEGFRVVLGYYPLATFHAFPGGILLTYFVGYVLVWAIVQGAGRQTAIDLLDVAGPLLAFVFCALAARRAGSQNLVRFWSVLAAALFLAALAESTTAFYELVRGIESPFPSVADLFGLVSYLLEFAAVMSLVSFGRRGRLATAGVGLEGLVFALAAILLTWQFIMLPSLDLNTSVLAKLVSVAYPGGDVLLLAALASMALLPRRGAIPSGLPWVAGAFLVKVVGDLAKAGGEITGTYTTGSWIDPLWPLAFAMLGAAAVWQLTQPRRTITDADAPESDLKDQMRVAVPYAAMPVACYVILSSQMNDGEPSYLYTAGPLAAGLVLVGLVLGRQAITLVENRRLHASLTVLSRDLEDRVDQRTRELSVLNQVAVTMSHCGSSKQVVEKGLRLTQEALGHEAVGLWLRPSGSRRRFFGGPGLTRSARTQLTAAAGQVFESDSGESADPIHDPVVLEATRGDGAGAIPSEPFAKVAVVPLVSRQTSLGALCLAPWDGDGRAEEPQLELASAVAAQVAVAFENVRRFEDAHYLAQRDPVTGLLNHRGITGRLDEEFSRCQRSGAEFSVVMMDLDNFKLFNDTYGHAVGDEVLQMVSRVLVKAVRKYDVVGRYGGDEFLALLPDTDADGAVVLVKRVQGAIKEGAFFLEKQSQNRVPIALSYGIATYPNQGGRLAEVMAVADANLYRSKQKGGDEITAPSVEHKPRREDGRVQRARRSRDHRRQQRPLHPPAFRRRLRSGGGARLQDGTLQRDPTRAADRGHPPRRGQDRGPRQRPAQARLAHRRGVRSHQAARGAGQAHHQGDPAPRRGALSRGHSPRTLRRGRLSGRAEGPRDPAARPHPGGDRRLLGDDHRPPVPEGLHDERGPHRTAASVRQAARPGTGGGLHRRDPGRGEQPVDRPDDDGLASALFPPRLRSPAPPVGLNSKVDLRKSPAEGEAVESTGMVIVHVQVHVHPESAEAFKKATTENARQSLNEPGVARFDVVQQQDDPTRFVLVEAYFSAGGAAAHKETKHYQVWRDTVASMMAEPRSSAKFTNVFPDAEAW